MEDRIELDVVISSEGSGKEKIYSINSFSSSKCSNSREFN